MSSWFAKYVEHPALSALAALVANPVIASNPDAAKAVLLAQTSATAIAATASTAGPVIASEAATAADPVISDLETGLQTLLDATLTSTLGPIGAIAVPAANTTLTLLEQRVQTYVASLFGHAKSQVAAASGTPAAEPKTA